MGPGTWGPGPGEVFLNSSNSKIRFNRTAGLGCADGGASRAIPRDTHLGTGPPGARRPKGTTTA